MSAAGTFLGSSIGKKVVMAVTGLILFGFVLGHMAGNMQLYLGAAALDAYGEMLRHALHGAGLWIARGVLLVSVALHIWAAAALTRANRAARPQGYRTWVAWESTYASRTMRWSGVILFLFIVYHLLHFTTGNAHPSFEAGHVYHNVVSGFSSVPVSLVYIVAMILLGFHLSHGVWSLFQTLGLSHPRYKRLVRTISVAFAVVVVLGNISFPLAVLAGLVK